MGSIYLKPVGGLCNRIRVIDSAILVANESRKRLVVIWEKNASLNCAYNELFQSSPAFDLIETKSFRGWSFPYYPDRSPTSLAKRTLFRLTRSRLGLNSSCFYDQLVDKLDALRPVTPEKYRNLDEFDEHTYDVFSSVAEQLKENTTSYLSACWRIVDKPGYHETFKPVTAIATKVEQITQRFTDQTFGVHIRGTDAETSKRYSSVAAFHREIEETIAAVPDATFFLASDEPAIKQRLIDKYPARMFFLNQTSYGRNSPKNIHNALVDLLCLASTRTVFGSYFSTFSQLAAHWNGIEESTVFNENALDKV